MSDPEEIVSKGEFAALCKVSAAAVSQWIRDGKISVEALVGEGRWAKIRVGLAMRQVGMRRDVGQALGNGISTRLEVGRRLPDPHARRVGDASDPYEGWSADGNTDAIDRRLKEAKLEAVERDNRIKAAEEAAGEGRYTDSAVMRAEMGKIAGQMVRIFEGMLPAIATALAAQFEVEARDVTHALNEQFRKVREQAAEAAAKNAQALPEKGDAPA